MTYEKMWIGYIDDTGAARFEISPNIFMKHAGIFGSTGSGKTVLGKILMEEMTLQKIPSIVIDPQGDISSLLVPNDDDVLKEKGVDLERKNDFFNSAEIRVFTPSSNKGIPISLNPVIFPPFNMDDVEVVRILDNVANTLVELLEKLVKYPPAKVIQSKSVIYTILLENWNRKKTIDNLQHLTNLIQNDEEFYQKFMNKTEKDKLVISLNNLLIGSTGLLFSGQAKLDIGSLLEEKDGKTPLNIFFLKSLLNENEKHLFISILIQALYSWMIQQGSTPNIKCFFYMDEMAPFMPAGMSSPPGKAMLLLLLRQARKYGVSCALASQSPKDIDYHGLDQINTFFFGRILSEQSQKVIRNLLSAKMNPERLDEIVNKITVLNTGQFIGFIPDLKDAGDSMQFKTRYLFSKHLTFTEADLKSIIHPDVPDTDQNEPLPDDQGASSQPTEDITGPGEETDAISTPPPDAVTQSSTTDAGSKQDYYKFKQLHDKVMEEILKRTVEYDFYDKLVNVLKIQRFVDISIFNPIIFDYIKKLLEKFEFEIEFEGMAENGIPTIISRREQANIAVSCIITENKTKIGVFGAYTSEQTRSQLEKLVDGVCELVKKVKI